MRLLCSEKEGEKEKEMQIGEIAVTGSTDDFCDRLITFLLQPY